MLPLFGNGPFQCLLDQPARPDQLLLSIRQMALIAGTVDLVYTHALRHGAARDVAHLRMGAIEGVGFANDTVRQSLGHWSRALASGVTEGYTGGTSADLYNARATNAKVHRREPRFASSNSLQPLEFVSAPVTDEQIADAQAKSKSGVGSKGAIKQVRRSRAGELARHVDAEPPMLKQAVSVEPSPESKQTTFRILRRRGASTSIPRASQVAHVARERQREPLRAEENEPCR